MVPKVLINGAHVFGKLYVREELRVGGVFHLLGGISVEGKLEVIPSEPGEDAIVVRDSKNTENRLTINEAGELSAKKVITG